MGLSVWGSPKHKSIYTEAWFEAWALAGMEAGTGGELRTRQERIVVFWAPQPLCQFLFCLWQLPLPAKVLLVPALEQPLPPASDSSWLVLSPDSLQKGWSGPDGWDRAGCTVEHAKSTLPDCANDGSSLALRGKQTLQAFFCHSEKQCMRKTGNAEPKQKNW